jgi:hypothetical protein
MTANEGLGMGEENCMCISSSIEPMFILRLLFLCQFDLIARC